MCLTKTYTYFILILFIRSFILPNNFPGFRTNGKVVVLMTRFFLLFFTTLLAAIFGRSLYFAGPFLSSYIAIVMLTAAAGPLTPFTHHTVNWNCYISFSMARKCTFNYLNVKEKGKSICHGTTGSGIESVHWEIISYFPQKSFLTLALGILAIGTTVLEHSKPQRNINVLFSNSKMKFEPGAQIFFWRKRSPQVPCGSNDLYILFFLILCCEFPTCFVSTYITI